MDANHLGQNIKKWLRIRGMKPIELSHRAEIDRSQLSRILHGKSLPSIESLARIANTLGVSAGDLLDDRQTKPVDDAIAELQKKTGLKVALRSIQKLNEEDQKKVLSIINQVVSMLDPTETSTN